MHPRRGPLYDDIYFGYLVLKAFQQRPMLLVNARLSEFDKSKPGRLDTQRGFTRIYHKLKSATRFGWVRNSSTLQQALRVRVRTAFTCGRHWKSLAHWAPRGLELNSSNAAWSNASEPLDGGLRLRGRELHSLANGSTCCERWVYCQGKVEPGGSAVR